MFHSFFNSVARSFELFYLQHWLLISHWSLRDSKFPKDPRTLLSILTDLNDAVVWMVSTCSLFSDSFSLFTTLLGIVPSAQTIIGFRVTFMFHRFFTSLARSRYLSLFSFSFIFTLWSVGTAKSTIGQVLFFCRLSPCLVVRPNCLYLKILENFVRLILQNEFRVLHIPLVCMVKFQFFVQLPVDYIPHPVVSCLILFLLHSLIMWLIVSFLSPHNLHLLFFASYLCLL